MPARDRKYIHLNSSLCVYLGIHCLVDIADGGLVFLGVLDDVGKYVVIASICGTVRDLVEGVVD